MGAKGQAFEPRIRGRCRQRRRKSSAACHNNRRGSCNAFSSPLCSRNNSSGMVEILNTPHEVEDHPDATSMRVGEGKIEFKHVDFGFHDTKKILDAISLTIAPGEKVALVGSSGAGKTTVVSLLERFHDIPSGEILIDGQNIAGVTQDSLRQNISFVPQEPILFHQTLKENIRYGKLDAADQ